MPFLPSRTLDHSIGMTSFGMREENEIAALRAYMLEGRKLGWTPEQVHARLVGGNNLMSDKRTPAPGFSRLAKSKNLLQRLRDVNVSEAARTRFEERTKGKTHSKGQWLDRVADNFHADMEYKRQQKYPKGEKKGKKDGKNKKDKKVTKKKDRKRAKRDTLSMIQKAYTAAPELKGQQKGKNRMTAWGHLMTVITQDPYKLGGKKADVFKEANFDQTIGFAVFNQAHSDAIDLCLQLIQTSSSILSAFPNGSVRMAVYDAIRQHTSYGEKIKTDVFRRVAASFERNVLERMDKFPAEIKDNSIYTRSLGPDDAAKTALTNADLAQCVENEIITSFQTFRHITVSAQKLPKGLVEVMQDRNYQTDLIAFLGNAYTKNGKDASLITPDLTNPNASHAQFRTLWQFDVKAFNLAYRAIQKMLYIIRHPHHASVLLSFRDCIIGLFDKDPLIRAKAMTIRSSLHAYITNLDITEKPANAAFDSVYERLHLVLTAPVPALQERGVPDSAADLLCDVKLRSDAFVQRSLWNAMHAALVGDRFDGQTALPPSEIPIKTFGLTGDAFMQNAIIQFYTTHAAMRTARLLLTGVDPTEITETFSHELKTAASYIRKSRNPNFIFKHINSVDLHGTENAYRLSYGVLGMANSLALTTLPILLDVTEAGKADAGMYGLSRLNWICRILGYGDYIAGYTTPIQYLDIPPLSIPSILALRASNLLLFDKKAAKDMGDEDDLSTRTRKALKASKPNGKNATGMATGVLAEVPVTPMQQVDAPRTSAASGTPASNGSAQASQSGGTPATPSPNVNSPTYAPTSPEAGAGPRTPQGPPPKGGGGAGGEVMDEF